MQICAFEHSIFCQKLIYVYFICTKKAIIMLFFEIRKMLYTFSNIHGSDILNLKCSLKEKSTNSKFYNRKFSFISI